MKEPENQGAGPQISAAEIMSVPSAVSLARYLRVLTHEEHVRLL